MNLGEASDWAVILGMTVGVITIALAVWRLARTATSLETSMAQLSHSHGELTAQLKEHLAYFAAYQREQASIISKVQGTVERLTWEVEHMKGDD